MTVTVTDFVEFIGGDEEDETNPRLIQCFNVAVVMVHRFIKSTFTVAEDPTTTTIPVVVVDLAILKVADELWNQRNTRGTVKEQMDFGAGLMSNTHRDPMLGAHNLLRGYVKPW